MDNKKSSFCLSEEEQSKVLAETLNDVKDDIPERLYDVGNSTQGCPKYRECIKRSFISGRTWGFYVGLVFGLLCMVLIYLIFLR